MTGNRPHRFLIGIILVAIALRVGAALYLGDVVVELPGTSDQLSYHALALRVLEGHGFSFATDWWPATRAGESTAHWSYLYTGYLVAVYWLFGPRPLAVRLIQAVVAGVLHPWLAYRLAHKLPSSPSLPTFLGGEEGQRGVKSEGGSSDGETVALVAAGLTAVYAYFIYYAGALMTETFYILSILWALDLAAGMGEGKMGQGDEERKGAGRWLLLGLALGIAALLRQVILLFVPFLLIWLWWAVRKSHRLSGDKRRAMCDMRYAVGTLAVLAALIAPWTVRNYHVFGRFVLLNTNAGYAFFWANHPVYGDHFVPILTPDMPSYQELIPTELRHLDEAALDQALLKRGLRFVLDDPLRYVRLSLSRIPAYFEFWPSPDSSPISNVARVGSFGLLLPFMLYGLWLSVVCRPWSIAGARWLPVTLLWLFIAVYTAIHLLSWALIRYRLPVDAVWLLFAGLAMVHLWERLVRP